MKCVSNISIASTGFIAELLDGNKLLELIIDGLQSSDTKFSKDCLLTLGHISVTNDLATIDRLVFECNVFERLQTWLNRTEFTIHDKVLWVISNILVTSDKHAYHLWNTTKIIQLSLELTKVHDKVALEALYVVAFMITTVKPA